MLKYMEIITQSDQETRKAGETLGEEILKEKKGLIVGLEGELGSGKTTFIQGLAKGLGIKDKITSPTFVIFKKYQIDKKNFYHVDCYRLKNGKDLIDLGFEEILKSKENIILIEWAEKVKEILPKETLWIRFKYLDKDKRGIRL